MQAGTLDRIITIEQETRTQDSTSGELVRSYSTLLRLAAAIAPLRMKEVILNNDGDTGNKVIGVERYNFTTRWFSGLNERCRIIYEGRIFNIKGYQEVGRRHWWNIQAECYGEQE